MPALTGSRQRGTDCKALFIVSLAAVWLRRERSILNILILILTMLAGLFITVMVVGEAFSGV
ncbi:MAG: hypothetical protein ABSF99_05945 [Anaerolineales bacterium]|jgi:hypothetical protein